MKHQESGAQAIVALLKDPNYKGAMLCDAMGMGKTGTIHIVMNTIPILLHLKGTTMLALAQLAAEGSIVPDDLILIVTLNFDLQLQYAQDIEKFFTNFSVYVIQKPQVL